MYEKTNHDVFLIKNHGRRRKWNIFLITEWKKKFHPRILNPLKLIFRSEGEKKDILR